MDRDFTVAFHSFKDVRDFVLLACTQSFDITVSNSWQSVNAKSLIVLLSLDYSLPLKVGASCAEDEFLHFRESAARFLV